MILRAALLINKRMKTVKLGRPKLKKHKAKGILIGARFNLAESRHVREAAKRAGMVKSEWIRTALLDAANFGKVVDRTMKIKLTVGEIRELKKTPSTSASKGGFQNFIVQIQYRINDDTGELELGSDDLTRIHRYAFHYKNGGYQNRLKRIFARNLGEDLLGR
jgi:hypothetical protein